MIDKLKGLFVLAINRVKRVDTVHEVLASLSDEVDRLNDIAEYHTENIVLLQSEIAAATIEIAESERELAKAKAVSSRLTQLIVAASSPNINELETGTHADS